MKKITILVFTLLFISNWVLARDDSSQKLPQFSLKDPAGKTHTQEELAKNGLVLVVTAPILSNKEEQEGWSKYLVETKSGKAKLALLEDMTPSYFKDKALSQMKKEYKPGEEPILLIDHNGEVRKKLGVPEKETVVLVFDKKGKQIYQEKGKPSASLAKRIWQKSAS